LAFTSLLIRWHDVVVCRDVVAYRDRLKFRYGKKQTKTNETDMLRSNIDDTRQEVK